MTPIEKAAQYAVESFRKWVGYHEKATNSQLDSFTANSGSGNYNRFSKLIDDLRDKGYNVYNGRKNGYAWCDASFDCNMIECFGVETAQKMLYQPWDSCGAGCEYSAGYYRSAGAWYASPKVGDQIFFGPKGNETHTGIVSKVEPNTVYTIEGNANDQVMERSYTRSSSNISGYGRPNYSLVADRFEEQKPANEKEPAISILDIEKLIDDKIENYMGKMVNTIDDIPWESVKKVMRKVLDSQAIDGGTPYETNPDDIGLPLSSVRVLTGAVRYIAYVVKEALNDG